MPISSKILLPIIILLALGGIFFGYQSLTTFREAEITIEWETASEVETVGFNILRGETPQGEFKQINAQLIPASSDPFSDNSYSYVDTNVQAGETYYYFLEDVEAGGRANRHGPLEIKAANQKWLEVALAVVMLFAAAAGGIQLRRYAHAPLGEDV